MIKQKLLEIKKLIKAENLRHEKEILLLQHEIDCVQSECEHEFRERSIMGRDWVSECSICGKEK